MAYVILGAILLFISAIWLLYLAKQNLDCSRIILFTHVLLILAGTLFFSLGIYYTKFAECPSWKQIPVVECLKGTCWVKFKIGDR